MVAVMITTRTMVEILRWFGISSGITSLLQRPAPESFMG